MKTYTKEELDNILADHKKWLDSDRNEGRRADLSDSYLSCSNLRGSNLRGSNLSGSNLSCSNLSGSNLSGSNLRDSNLRGSDLSGSDLRDSNLSGSDLSGSNLRDSNLSGSHLSGSDLQEVEGLMFAQTSWNSHGECGRMLTAVEIDNSIVYFCGCFKGSAEELQKFIDQGEDEYKESRQLVFDFVKKCMEISTQQK